LVDAADFDNKSGEQGDECARTPLNSTSFAVPLPNEGRAGRSPGSPWTYNSAGFLRLQILIVNAKLIRSENIEIPAKQI
jgi:hypothetical protein